MTRDEYKIARDDHIAKMLHIDRLLSAAGHDGHALLMAVETAALARSRAYDLLTSEDRTALHVEWKAETRRLLDKINAEKAAC